MTQPEIEEIVRQFEGLVHRTAHEILEAGVELDFDDVRQFLRIKVWKAVQRFDAQRARESRHLSHAKDRYGRTPLQRFVFMCVVNMRKDIEKRPRRFNQSIESLRSDEGWRVQYAETYSQRADRFDAKYLSVDAEEVYAEVEANDDLPPQMARLTPIERQVVLLRMRGRMLCEIDRELGLSRAQREKVLQSVREKLAELNPAHEPRSAPMPPLPLAEPRPRRVPEPLAA